MQTALASLELVGKSVRSASLDGQMTGTLDLQLFNLVINKP